MESGCYTGMAALYDTLMQDVDYDRWTDSLVRLIERYGDAVHDDRIRVIDCACGTGAITVRLAERGMELTGLDCSEDMLRFASEKAMRAGLRIPFVHMDMRSIAVHRRADAVVCCCDGVNYLTDERAVNSFFRSAHAALHPGGLLLFDVSSAYKLEHVLGCNTLGEDRAECTYLWENMYDPASRLLEMRLHFFVPDGRGRYRRFDERHIQRAHRTEELAALLERSGFSLLSITEALTDAAPAETSERIQFAARRNEE